MVRKILVAFFVILVTFFIIWLYLKPSEKEIPEKLIHFKAEKVIRFSYNENLRLDSILRVPVFYTSFYQAFSPRDAASCVKVRNGSRGKWTDANMFQSANVDSNVYYKIMCNHFDHENITVHVRSQNN